MHVAACHACICAYVCVHSCGTRARNLPKGAAIASVRPRHCGKKVARTRKAAALPNRARMQRMSRQTCGGGNHGGEISAERAGRDALRGLGWAGNGGDITAQPQYTVPPFPASYRARTQRRRWQACSSGGSYGRCFRDKGGPEGVGPERAWAKWAVLVRAKRAGAERAHAPPGPPSDGPPPGGQRSGAIAAVCPRAGRPLRGCCCCCCCGGGGANARPPPRPRGARRRRRGPESATPAARRWVKHIPDAVVSAASTAAAAAAGDAAAAAAVAAGGLVETGGRRR
jgi:hypothetical protein